MQYVTTAYPLRNLSVCLQSESNILRNEDGERILHAYDKFSTFHPALLKNILRTFMNFLCSVQNLFTSSRFVDLSLTPQLRSP